MDCYCHPQNASGLEIPMCEALYCELPLATNPYAAGETFASQEFVYPIDFAWTVQLGTQFKRAAPYSSSVAKFIKKIYNTSIEDRNKIGKKGREWAISQFSPEVVCKQWEDYLDSLPKIDWDYNFAPEAKNPNAVIPNIQDEGEWIIALYREILKMTVDKNDSGFLNWIEQLKKGMSRQDIHNFFIQTAVQENQKNQPPIPFETVLLNNGKKNLLIILKESIGDIILSTSLLKSFRQNYPNKDWNIYYATKPEYRQILEGNTNVDKILDFQDFMEQELICTGYGKTKGMFDAYAHLGNSQQHKLNYLTNNNINLPCKIK